MSGSLALSSVLVAGQVAAQVLLHQPRAINDIIIPDCAIEEHHSDRMTITHHPVEKGAQISDHAYKEPMEVSLRYGWSEGILTNGIIDGVYEDLLELQKNGKPFNILTGKRSYINMMITDLEVTTDAKTSSVLLVEIRCIEVIIVKTKAASIGPASEQKMPEQTGGEINTGQQQLSPVPTSSVAEPF